MKLTRSALLLGFLLVFSAGALAQSGSYRRGRDSDDDGQQAQQDSHKDSHRKFTSRSGKVSYSGTNNFVNKKASKPIQIQPAPTRNQIDESAARNKEREAEQRAWEEQQKNNGNHGHGDGHDRDHEWDRDHDRDRDGDHDGDRNNNRHYRVGYYHYDKTFRDNNFEYPYYIFDPYQTNNCVVSPWYYYSFLPAYVNTNRLVISPDYSGPVIGFQYDYQQPSRYQDDSRDARYDNNYVSRRALDYAIDDIVNAFLHQDKRAVDHLVPRGGTVTLEVDNTISYGIRADDFYDMLMDAVMNSRTVDYQILSVTTSDDEAEVIARHDYLDSWGERQSVYHKYHLFGERGNIVIRYFETAANMFY